MHSAQVVDRVKLRCLEDRAITTYGSAISRSVSLEILFGNAEAIVVATYSMMRCPAARSKGRVNESGADKDRCILAREVSTKKVTVSQ